MTSYMTLKARLVKKCKQADKKLTWAQRYISEVMATMLPEHPDREAAFRDILDTIDLARHNLYTFTQRNFRRARYKRYTRARLNNMIRKSKSLKRPFD